MSLFWGRKTEPESRSLVVPVYGPMGTADSGYVAAPTSATDSLQSVAVRSAVDLIASLISELPLDVYRGRGSSRVEVPRPGYLEDPSGGGEGVEDWVYQLLVSWLLRGNAYGDVLEHHPARGFPTQISWYHPDEVRGSQNPTTGEVTWWVNGREVTNPSRFLHKRVNPVPGVVLGLSPIEVHATTIGLSLTSTRFGARWFADGATPGGILTNSEVSLDASEAATAKARFKTLLQGTRDPVVLGKGWDYKGIQIAPEESQFLETQGFTEAQCARMFGPGIAEVLGYETGKSMTYANVVDRRVDVLVFTLNRWARRVERVLTAMLPRPQYAKFNRDALLEATTEARYAAYEIALRNGFRTINEVRDDEDETPVEWGDTPYQAAQPAGPTGGTNGNAA